MACISTSWTNRESSVHPLPRVQILPTAPSPFLASHWLQAEYRSIDGKVTRDSLSCERRQNIAVFPQSQIGRCGPPKSRISSPVSANQQEHLRPEPQIMGNSHDPSQALSPWISHVYTMVHPEAFLENFQRRLSPHWVFVSDGSFSRKYLIRCGSCGNWCSLNLTTTTSSFSTVTTEV